jgi:hypothetical protein
MNPRPEAWTVVVQGAWNLRIFSPDWVAKNVFEGKPMTMDVAIGPFQVPVRYKSTSDGVTLTPSADRLVFGVVKADVTSMLAAEAGAQRVLALLKHTPIMAIGVNVGYYEDTASEWVHKLFGMHDIDGLSHAGCDIKLSNITRSVERNGDVINITIALDGEGRTEVLMNFHKETPSNEDALARLSGSAKSGIDGARELLTNAYGAILED